MKGLSIVAAALALLAGCATAPETRYHMLDMSAAGELADATVNVEVDQLRAAQALRRPTLMIKRSPTEVEYYAEHEWSADVAELVTEKFRAEFGDPVPGKPTILIAGHIRAFEQVDTPDGPKPHIKIEIAFRTPDTSRYEEPLLEVTYENDYSDTPPVAAATASADDQATAVVRGLSNTLEKLAATIQRDAVRAAALAQEEN
ncbi:MAG: ABC-type transport auxiliary lipoprotein family protein [Candidatus Hydrogenedentota bacterium]